MGRQKTKYTKTDACIYILYCILINEFNSMEGLFLGLEISLNSRQAMTISDTPF